jgi:glutamate dehydrogenase (NAD(P)+)
MALGTAVGIRESAASSIRDYFEAAAERIKLHPEMRRLLSVPFQELNVELPLRRDDGRLQLFRGYRVQHNGVRGPLLGSTRVQAELDLADLRSVAESMTWRCAVANVPFGGAAGGVRCEPIQLSRRELERLMRRYASAVHHLLGIYQDVCTPGPNAGPEVMAWIADEFALLHEKSPAASVGRPAESGGLPDRDAIVGRALAALTVGAVQDCNKPISGLRVAVKSLDRSAIHTAEALVEAGCIVVGIAEERGVAYSAAGINVDALACQLQHEGTFGLVNRADDSQMHTADCDVLVIGDSECTLNNTTASHVRAQLIIEASELVISPLAERNFAGRNVLVIPDLVSAAATILAANAEWSSNLQKLSAATESFERQITASLVKIYEQVLDRSRRENTSLRMAAYCAAIERVSRLERLRVG